MSPVCLDLRQAGWFGLEYKYLHREQHFVGIRDVLIVTPDVIWSPKIRCFTAM